MKTKGIVSISETTSILGSEYLLEAKNVEADGFSIKNRNGVTQQGLMQYYTMGREPEVHYMNPIAIKAVTIASQEIILIVNHNGLVFGIIPEHYNQMYNIKRNYFGVYEHLDCRIGVSPTPPTRCDILEYSNHIYIITNQGSWAIIKNGLFTIEASAQLDDSIVVDALNATLEDLDDKFPKLEQISKTKFSQLEAGTRVFVRNVSELGGRGYPSEIAEIKEQGSYFIHDVGSIPRITNSFVNGVTCRKPIAKLLRTSNTSVWPTSADPWSGWYAADYKTNMNRMEISRFMDLDSQYTNYYPKKKMTLVTKNGAVDAFVSLVSRINNPDGTFIATLQISTYSAASHTTTSTATYFFDSSYVALGTGRDRVDTDRTNYNCVLMVNSNGEGIMLVPAYEGIVDTVVNGAILTAKSLTQYELDMKYEVASQGVVAMNNCFEIIVTSNLTITGRDVSYTQADADVITHRQGISKIRHSAKLSSGSSSFTRFTTDERIEFIPIHSDKYGVNDPMTNIQLRADDSETVPIQNSPYSYYVTVKVVGNKFSNSYDIPSLLYYLNKDNSYNTASQTIELPGISLSAPVFYTGWDGNTSDLGAYIDEAYLYVEAATEDLFLNPTNGTVMRYLPDDSQRFSFVQGLGTGKFGACALGYDPKDYRIGLKSTKLRAIATQNKVDDVVIITTPSLEEISHKLYEGYIEEDGYDLLVARQDTNKTILSDVDVSNNYSTVFGLTDESDFDYNHPLAMTKRYIWAAAQPKDYTRAPGDFIKAVVFNGYICAYETNVIKLLNEKLEWEVENTIEVPASINNIESLGNSLYIFTDSGIYVLLPDMSIDFLTSIIVEKACVAGSQIVMVDINGDIYKTEFTPMPVAQYNRQTKNPYIITKVTSDIIHNITEGWVVKDMQYVNGTVYITTEANVLYLFNVDDNSFFEHELPVDSMSILVPLKERMFLLSGSLTAQEEIDSPAVEQEYNPGG